MTHQSLPFCRAADLDEPEHDQSWLVESLWSRSAVGFVGGMPKLGKTWLALDLALSVASDTPCLGVYDVAEPGSTLVYLAEDHPSVLRQRLSGMCRQRGLELQDVPLHVITVPSLRLDLERDQQRLVQTVRSVRPKLLLLDPLVRLHRKDENHSGDVSELLAFLRQLQREYDVAVVVVHHMRKNGPTGLQAGQALRGSGDFHAWTDSALYLRAHKSRVLLRCEHRSAPAPDPIEIKLVSPPDGSGTHLEVVLAAEAEPATDQPATSLTQRAVELLKAAQRPQTRLELRRCLRVNNQRLGQTLDDLQAQGVIVRSRQGWSLASL